MDSPQVADSKFRLEARAETPAISVEVRRYGKVPPGAILDAEPRNTIGLHHAAHTVLHARYPERAAPTPPFSRVGATVFRPRQVPWEAMCAGGTVESVICAFEDDLLESALGERPDWTPEELQHGLDLRSSPIAQMLRLLRTEAMSPGFASPLIIEGTATAMVAHLVRCLRRQPTVRKPLREGLTAAQLRSIDDFLQALSGRSPTATDLAGICGISVRSLQRKLAHSTGMSIAVYVAEAQTARAKTLLRDRRLPLKEVAFQLGFSSHSNFSAAFRKATGLTPSGYRKALG
jgi:AraC family transcriptional regulator